MPDWLRDVCIALGAFIGGRAVNAIAENMKDRRDLHRSVDKMTVVMEAISGDLKDIRGEIHTQVQAVKTEIHDAVGGLRGELHQHIQEQGRQIEGIENRMDNLGNRIDALSIGMGWSTGPQRTVGVGIVPPPIEPGQAET